MPWVTGWQIVDCVLTWALAPEQRVLHLLLDPLASDTLSVEPLPLIAANASCTVALTFRDHFVPSERLIANIPYEPPPAYDGGGRSNGSLALGVTQRCCTLMGASPFDTQLAQRRTELDGATDTTMADAGAAAVELSLRASAALIATQGSRSIVAGQHAPRLAREALFLLVFGTRPAIKSSLLARLAGSGEHSSSRRGGMGSAHSHTQRRQEGPPAVERPHTEPSLTLRVRAAQVVLGHGPIQGHSLTFAFQQRRAFTAAYRIVDARRQNGRLELSVRF